MPSTFTSTFILLLALSVATVAAHGDEPDEHDRCTCNRAVSTPADPSTLRNAAQRVASITISLIPGAPAEPHQHAIITGAMFEAFALVTGGKQLTSVNVDKKGLSNDDAVGYAGFAALSRALASSPDKLSALNAAMENIGLSHIGMRDSFGMPIAIAVSEQFPLTLPPPMYVAPNKPSKSADALCSAVRKADKWQPLCLTPAGASKCSVQMAPILPLVNASLISAGGGREVNDLIKGIPPPPTFSGPLRKFAKSGKNAFVRDFRAVLTATSRLDDRRKTIAEVFAPNAVRAVVAVALDEVAERGFALRRSVSTLFTVAAAARDSLVGSSTIKVRYSSTRPITVLQCGLIGKRISGWKGPYQGTGAFVNSRKMPWRTYIQTPAFPGYVSGHTAVSVAAMEVLKTLLGEEPRAANCFVVKAGGSLREPRLKPDEAGFIPGVTNARSKGKGTPGYSPGRKTTICWKSFEQYSRLVALSRIYGGVHTPLDNKLAVRLGKKGARRVLRYMEDKA